MRILLIILLIVFLLLYLFSPIDILPDGIPILGWIDDAFLVGLFYYYIRQGKLPGFLYWWKRPQTDQYYQQYKIDDHQEKTKEKASASTSGSESKDPYDILGLKPGASQDDIQSAYREAVQKYHPDKVSHLGEEFQEMAKQKFIDIQEAYEKLKTG